MNITDEMIGQVAAVLHNNPLNDETLRKAIEAVAPLIQVAALEEARQAVADAGWYQNSPDVKWEIVDCQIDHSESAITDLIRNSEPIVSASPDRNPLASP